jgi:hypothetical protein
MKALLLVVAVLLGGCVLNPVYVTPSISTGDDQDFGRYHEVSLRMSTEVGAGVSLFGTVVADRWTDYNSTGVSSYIGFERTFTLFGGE